MGDFPRVLWQSLSFFYDPVVTSAATDVAQENGYDGDRNTRWIAGSTADQTWTFDAGLGQTVIANALFLARADLLTASGISVAVEHSDNMSTWATTNGFTPVAMAPGVMLGPGGVDFYKEWNGNARRGWRVKLTGATAPAEIVELILGQYLEFEAGAIYPATFTVARPLRGADLDISFRGFTATGIRNLMSYVAGVSPGAPGELPVETLGGKPYGGVPHVIVDPLGRLFHSWETPAVARGIHAVLMNPLEVNPQSITRHIYEVGPLRYRQLV